MYHLEDLSGRPISNVDYGDLAVFTDDDAKLVPGQPESNGTVYNFNLIDTPGLDDSDGNDLEIMAEIIGRISDLSHLNAVLYVRSINKPFGKSFKNLYDYLQRSMPVIANGVIVINTSCSVEKFDEALTKIGWKHFNEQPLKEPQIYLISSWTTTRTKQIPLR
jgi:GTPase Era involved in 16S rRNA processing